MGADAAVDARAEGEVFVGGTCEVDGVRVAVHLGIHVRDGEDRPQPFARGHRAAIDLGRRHHDAGDGRHRGLESQQLLDRAGGQVGIIGELSLVRGVLRQEREAALERVGDRVEAGREHEEADVQRLVPREATLLLQREEGPEHVAGVVLGVCLERRREVLEDPGARLHPHGLTVVLRLTDGTDHPLFRLHELVEPVRGQAHQAEEHDGREREGELGAEVAAPSLDERVDQLVREVGDLLLGAQPCVAGRTRGRASSGSASGPVGRPGAGSLRSPTRSTSRRGSTRRSRRRGGLARHRRSTSQLPCRGPVGRGVRPQSSPRHTSRRVSTPDALVEPGREDGTCRRGRCIVLEAQRRHASKLGRRRCPPPVRSSASATVPAAALAATHARACQLSLTHDAARQSCPRFTPCSDARTMGSPSPSTSRTCMNRCTPIALAQIHPSSTISSALSSVASWRKVSSSTA